ncbi:MAG: hypothetical protein KAV87_67865 [Desulfobacteraceae bacterium]|nr:hypothetical protein [Desulfobacteraceae bacterium]
MYIALKPLKIQHGRDATGAPIMERILPGEPVPGASEWPNLKAWVSAGKVRLASEEEISEPAIALRTASRVLAKAAAAANAAIKIANAAREVADDAADAADVAEADAELSVARANEADAECKRIEAEARASEEEVREKGIETASLEDDNGNKEPADDEGSVNESDAANTAESEASGKLTPEEVGKLGKAELYRTSQSLGLNLPRRTGTAELADAINKEFAK